MRQKQTHILSACIGIAAFTLLLFTYGLLPAAASEKAEKPDWLFHDIVDVKFVMQHISIPMPDNVMIIDARPFKPKYVQGHIPMAVSIPNTQFDKMVDKLPKDKNALLIYYCGGLKCKLSHKSPIIPCAIIRFSSIKCKGHKGERI